MRQHRFYDKNAKDAIGKILRQKIEQKGAKQNGIRNEQ